MADSSAGDDSGVADGDSDVTAAGPLELGGAVSGAVLPSRPDPDDPASGVDGGGEACTGAAGPLEPGSGGSPGSRLRS